MSDGGSIRAGGVHFDIGANAAALKKSLRDSQGEVSKTAKQMAAEAVAAARAQEAELTKVVKRIRQQLSLGSLTDFERGGLDTKLADATKQLGEVQAKLPQEIVPDTVFGRLGDKASNALSNAITKGLVGVAAVNAIDQGLREIGDRIRAATASGGSLSGLEIGVLFGESFIKGLESIPLAGALGVLAGEAIDSLTGGSLALERQLSNIRNAADEFSRARGEITEALRDLQRQALTGVAREVEDLNRSIDARLNDLLAKIEARKLSERILSAQGKSSAQPLTADEIRLATLGGSDPNSEAAIRDRSASLREAQDAVAPLRDEGLKQIADRIAASFDSALERVDGMTGALDQQAEILRQVDRLAQQIAESYAAIGRTEEGIARADAIRERARLNLAAADERKRIAELQKKADDAANESAREAEQTLKQLDGIIAGIERRFADLNKTSLEQLRDELRSFGAGDDVIERVLSMQAAIDQAAVGPLSPKTFSTFSTFLASRLDQQVANEPVRKLDDKVGKIQRDLERILRELRDPSNGLSFGA